MNYVNLMLNMGQGYNIIVKITKTTQSLSLKPMCMIAKNHWALGLKQQNQAAKVLYFPAELAEQREVLSVLRSLYSV